VREKDYKRKEVGEREKDFKRKEVREIKRENN
jgi:hypothetical protein